MTHHNIIYSQDNLYFVSDTHFSHTKIMEYCKRPFSDVREMNKVLLERWNEKIPKNGIVFFLGDFAWGTTTSAQHLLERLNGKKHLIIGNHDKTILKKDYNKNMFESIQYYTKIRVDDKEARGGKGYQEICLFHYPILAWDKIRHGSWHLFGHEHGNFSHHTTHGITSNQACLDVGVDCDYCDFTPLSYFDVKRLIIAKISTEKSL